MKRTRQQRRALQREFQKQPSQVKTLITETALIRENGYIFPRRMWEAYFMWRRYGMGAVMSFINAVKVARMETL